MGYSKILREDTHKTPIIFLLVLVGVIFDLFSVSARGNPKKIDSEPIDGDDAGQPTSSSFGEL